jgi:TPR repeat protein
VAWFEKAATGGNAEAQKCLAWIYFMGKAGEPDMVLGYAWYLVWLEKGGGASEARSGTGGRGFVVCGESGFVHDQPDADRLSAIAISVADEAKTEAGLLARGWEAGKALRRGSVGK